MSQKCLLVLLGLLFHFCSADPPPFPNIGYLGCGYDLIFGNPHSTDEENSQDPGYRQPIYDLTQIPSFSTSFTTTPDQQYKTPPGIMTELCNSCSLDNFYTKIYTGGQGYQATLSEEVLADFSRWKSRFTASDDYHLVTNFTTGTFTETVATCCVYKARLSPFIPPAFSPIFRTAISRMPTTYNKTTKDFFTAFLVAFGTHVTSAVTFGSKFGQRSHFTSYNWSLFSTSIFRLGPDVLAGSSALNSAPTVPSQENSLDVDLTGSIFSSFADNQKTFATGAEVPADRQNTTWFSSSKQNPMPLSIQLDSLDTLLSSSNFPEDGMIHERKDALSKALSDYCNTVRENDQVFTSCSGPKTDPPVPSPSIYGGQYQVSDCESDETNIANPYTSKPDCNPGYSSHLIARYLFTPSCSANMYLCLLENHSEDPLHAFGGAYQEGLTNNPLQPMDSHQQCGEGYTDVHTATVLDENGESYIYMCLNVSASLDQINVAGGFQKPLSGSLPGSVTNWYTYNVACPKGFSQLVIGRAYLKDAGNMATMVNLYACTNNYF